MYRFIVFNAFTWWFCLFCRIIANLNESAMMTKRWMKFNYYYNSLYKFAYPFTIGIRRKPPSVNHPHAISITDSLSRACPMFLYFLTACKSVGLCNVEARLFRFVAIALNLPNNTRLKIILIRILLDPVLWASIMYTATLRWMQCFHILTIAMNSKSVIHGKSSPAILFDYSNKPIQLSF